MSSRLFVDFTAYYAHGWLIEYLIIFYSSFRNQLDPTLYGLDSRKMNPETASSDWMLF